MKATTRKILSFECSFCNHIWDSNQYKIFIVKLSNTSKWFRYTIKCPECGREVTLTLPA